MPLLGTWMSLLLVLFPRRHKIYLCWEHGCHCCWSCSQGDTKYTSAGNMDVIVVGPVPKETQNMPLLGTWMSLLLVLFPRRPKICLCWEHGCHCCWSCSQGDPKYASAGNMDVIVVGPVPKETQNIPLLGTWMSLLLVLFPRRPKIFLCWGTWMSLLLVLFPRRHKIYLCWEHGCHCCWSCSQGDTKYTSAGNMDVIVVGPVPKETQNIPLLGTWMSLLLVLFPRGHKICLCWEHECHCCWSCSQGDPKYASAGNMDVIVVGPVPKETQNIPLLGTWMSLLLVLFPRGHKICLCWEHGCHCCWSCSQGDTKYTSAGNMDVIVVGPVPKETQNMPLLGTWMSLLLVLFPRRHKICLCWEHGCHCCWSCSQGDTKYASAGNMDVIVVGPVPKGTQNMPLLGT